MATAKKTSAKRTSAVKKTPAKQAPAKQTNVKRVTTKKASVKSDPKMHSFRVSPDFPAFRTFKITRQTVYWVIIVSFIIFMQLWILALQMETSAYIEAQISSLQEEM
jgi:uncharacterized integral membrane protein